MIYRVQCTAAIWYQIWSGLGRQWLRYQCMEVVDARLCAQVLPAAWMFCLSLFGLKSHICYLDILPVIVTWFSGAPGNGIGLQEVPLETGMSVPAWVGTDQQLLKTRSLEVCMDLNAESFKVV